MKYLVIQDTPVLMGGIQIGETMIRYIGKDIQKLGEGEAIWQDQVATCGSWILYQKIPQGRKVAKNKIN